MLSASNCKETSRMWYVNLKIQDSVLTTIPSRYTSSICSFPHIEATFALRFSTYFWFLTPSIFSFKLWAMVCRAFCRTLDQSLIRPTWYLFWNYLQHSISSTKGFTKDMIGYRIMNSEIRKQKIQVWFGFKLVTNQKNACAV